MSVIEFGLIGHPLGHSLSPFIHRSLLAAAGLPGDYRLYDLTADELPDVVPNLVRASPGFNCTIPYKETIIPYLAGLDADATRIRAVNTIWRGWGYNTDYAAFTGECPLPAGSKVLLLGAGGVSRTMAFAAAAAGCTICLTARRPVQAESLAADVRRLFPTSRISCLDLVAWRRQAARSGETGADGWILLNGTPVGLWPHPAAMPVEPDDLGFCRQVYDTIYNPVATRLVLSARSRGIPAQGGLGMLFAQAVAAQEIWHPGYRFAEPIKCSVRQQLARAIISQSPLTFVMTGFMGCGKTTLGRALAELLELPFVDLDHSIEQDSGRTIPDIFATDGEAAFRSLEQAALRRMISSGRSQVLATGGGALLAEQARQMLRSGPALVIYLDVTMDKILSRVGNGGGRPMLSGRSAADWSALYEQRQPLYRDLADLVFRPGEDVSENVRRIASLLGLSA